MALPSAFQRCLGVRRRQPPTPPSFRLVGAAGSPDAQNPALFSRQPAQGPGAAGSPGAEWIWEGSPGGVVDLGLLSMELRGVDSRVMTVPNSGCEPVVNHTKQCSGAELRLPLAPGGLDLPHVLEVVRQDVTAFAADSGWQPLLLQPPQLRGVSEVTVDAVWLSVLLTTLAGRHDAARRDLIACLVERLGREGIASAASAR